MRNILQHHVHTELAYVRDLRHRLHRIPEPAFEEKETSALIAEELAGLELAVTTGVGGTGIVADLDTGRPGGVVALRADMDALPVDEGTRRPYHSTHPGYAHACGHDGHMAVLVGAARAAAAMRDRLHGRIRFVFQPAEEITRGAARMIAEGVLDTPRPDAAFALHGWPDLPVGKVASMPGTVMANCDVFTVRVVGKGGHGARPQFAKNPLVGVARVVEALTAMTTGERVVSPCIGRAGQKVNVIAETGEVAGTVRTLNSDMREKTRREIERVASETCAEAGMKAETTFEEGTSAVVVSPQMYELFCDVAARYIGRENVASLNGSSMGAEDFGEFLARVPGVMFRLGLGRTTAELHNPGFDFNDDALETGMMVLLGLGIHVAAHAANE